MSLIKIKFTMLKAAPYMDFLVSYDITTRAVIKAHREQEPEQDDL
jgi:hypothetical protein